MYTHDICAHICTVYVYTSAVQWCLTSTNSTFQLDAFVKNEPMNQLHRKKMSQNLLLFMFCWFCRVPMFMPCFFFVSWAMVNTLFPWFCQDLFLRSAWSLANDAFKALWVGWSLTIFVVCLVDKNDCWRWRHWMFEEIYLKHTKMSVWICLIENSRMTKNYLICVCVVDCVRVEFSFST